MERNDRPNNGRVTSEKPLSFDERIVVGKHDEKAEKETEKAQLDIAHPDRLRDSRIFEDLFKVHTCKSRGKTENQHGKKS